MNNKAKAIKSQVPDYSKLPNCIAFAAHSFKWCDPPQKPIKTGELLGETMSMLKVCNNSTSITHIENYNSTNHTDDNSIGILVYVLRNNSTTYNITHATLFVNGILYSKLGSNQLVHHGDSDLSSFPGIVKTCNAINSHSQLCDVNKTFTNLLLVSIASLLKEKYSNFLSDLGMGQAEPLDEIITIYEKLAPQYPSLRQEKSDKVYPISRHVSAGLNNTISNLKQSILLTEGSLLEYNDNLRNVMEFFFQSFKTNKLKINCSAISNLLFDSAFILKSKAKQLQDTGFTDTYLNCKSFFIGAASEEFCTKLGKIESKSLANYLMYIADIFEDVQLDSGYGNPSFYFEVNDYVN
ncbi:DUF7689 domain-containing protein [Candidatus Cyrtobacter comes]|uniref:DUF7689 domain-containing protein n=1 Tax=Candidatus Cyrtobacter comes TaxID=675776 RepID=UPI002ACE2509|nr:hypothetical protein [Candidatus Cyrtobacter comes]